MRAGHHTCLYVMSVEAPSLLALLGFMRLCLASWQLLVSASKTMYTLCNSELRCCRPRLHYGWQLPFFLAPLTLGYGQQLQIRAS